ncbi:MAG TPA: ABC transporter ATP-binding protein, partial [Acidobacteriota bacterium]|nr:ABC transporter ATP-binding protein [Acidobacteriota bacterium]
FSYGQKRVLRDLGFSIRGGEIFGLLGANGAGKTTTLRLLSGLLTPGQILVGGHDLALEPEQAKSKLGFLADNVALFDQLTGREHLQYLASLRSMPFRQSEQRIDRLLKVLELESVANELCHSYSLGMTRKLGLASALLHQPEVLLLDEPFSGLDPPGRHRLKQLLAQMATQGVAVLLSTHELSVAEEVCGRLGILSHGGLVLTGTPEDLREQHGDLEFAFMAHTQTRDLGDLDF